MRDARAPLFPKRRQIRQVRFGIRRGERLQPRFGKRHAAAVFVQSQHRGAQLRVIRFCAEKIRQLQKFRRRLFIGFKQRLLQGFQPPERQLLLAALTKARVQIQTVKILANDLLAKRMNR